MKLARCHYCPFTHSDAEVVLAHIWTHPEADRRAENRAARDAARRAA